MPNSPIKSTLCTNMKDLRKKSRVNVLEDQDLAVDNKAKIEQHAKYKPGSFLFPKKEDMSSVPLCADHGEL